MGELLGLLAHDLRNPLSALHSNLGYLKSLIATADTDTREAIEDGLVSCDGLAHIIDNIDLFGQSLRGGDAAEGALVDLSLVIADVVAATRSMAQSHGVEVVLALSATSGATAQGSREYVSRALANLVRNSIQHSSSSSKVTLSLRAEGPNFVVVVADTGVSVGGTADDVFTAEGQVGAKSVPNGRYSRGLGLYAAAIAASAGQATVRVGTPPPGATSAFELVVARKSG
jgi:signal transduction histidine kinase